MKSIRKILVVLLVGVLGLVFAACSAGGAPEMGMSTPPVAGVDVSGENYTEIVENAFDHPLTEPLQSTICNPEIGKL